MSAGIVVLLAGLAIGCGAGSDNAAPALAQDIKAQDIGQCLAGQGWGNVSRAVSAKPGAGVSHLSTSVDSPSDGTTVLLTDEQLDADMPSGPVEFHVVGKYAAVDVTIAGLSITDDERAQIEDCAGG